MRLWPAGSGGLLLAIVGWGLGWGAAHANESSYTRPFAALPAEIVEIRGAVNLLNAPGHEVNATLGDQLTGGEAVLVGVGGRVSVRLKDGTRLTARGEARFSVNPLDAPGLEEAAEVVMTTGHFRILRPGVSGRLPQYRLVSACGAVLDGGQSFEVKSRYGECVYDGLNIADPIKTPVVAVFAGYGRQPFMDRQRRWVFTRDTNWHTGPADLPAPAPAPAQE